MEVIVSWWWVVAVAVVVAVEVGGGGVEIVMVTLGWKKKYNIGLELTKRFQKSKVISFYFRKKRSI